MRSSSPLALLFVPPPRPPRASSDLRTDGIGTQRLDLDGDGALDHGRRAQGAFVWSDERKRIERIEKELEVLKASSLGSANAR